MKEITKKYTNGEITVTWKPGMCIHSAVCFKGLPEVFDPRRKPWIEMDQSSTEKIMEQIKRCPSGALSFELNNSEQTPEPAIDGNLIEVTPDGPLLIHGNITVKDREGNSSKKENVTAFCRCGHSNNKPYCDGSHRKVGFTG